MKIQLGDKVKDKVTGYIGIVTCESLWLNGCKRFTVQSDKPQNGAPAPDICVDENQLQLVKSGVVVTGRRETGGPAPTVRLERTPR